MHVLRKNQNKGRRNSKPEELEMAPSVWGSAVQ